MDSQPAPEDPFTPAPESTPQPYSEQGEPPGGSKKHWAEGVSPAGFLQELKFLASCEVSLQMSIQFWERLRDLMSKNVSGAGDEQFLQTSLFQSGVLAYCRPFKISKTFNDIERSINTKQASRFDPEAVFNRAIHKQLLHLRNKLIAHHDLLHLDASVRIRSITSGIPGRNLPPSMCSVLGTDVIIEIHSVQGPKTIAHLDAMIKHARAVTFSIQGLRLIQEALFLETMKQNPAIVITQDPRFEEMPPVQLAPNSGPVRIPRIEEVDQQIKLPTHDRLDLRGLTLIGWILLSNWNGKRDIFVSELQPENDFPS